MSAVGKKNVLIGVLIAVIILLALLLWFMPAGETPTGDVATEPLVTTDDATEDATSETPKAQTSTETTPKIPTKTYSGRTFQGVFLMKGSVEVGQTGTLSIKELSATKVRVEIRVGNAPAGSVQPAAIHEKGCSAPEGTAYPLNNVRNGYSSTDLNVAFNKLLFGNFPYSVIIRKSLTELPTLTSCADLIGVVN